MRTEQFDLLKAQMDAAKSHMLRELNRELFLDVVAKPVLPFTRRQQLALKWGRVRRYCSTLWDALRGRDPYDWGDY